MPNPYATMRPQPLAEVETGINDRFDRLARYTKALTGGSRLAKRLPDMLADQDRRRDAQIAMARVALCDTATLDGLPISENERAAHLAPWLEAA